MLLELLSADNDDEQGREAEHAGDQLAAGDAAGEDADGDKKDAAEREECEAADDGGGLQQAAAKCRAGKKLRRNAMGS